MKVMLRMLARSDSDQEPLLERILSIVGPCFDDVAFVEDGGEHIVDFGAQRNRLIDIGERRGFDWMFMLDSDECMFPRDIETVRSLMTPENRFPVDVLPPDADVENGSWLWGDITPFEAPHPLRDL